MDLHAELARLNATPELPEWVAGTVQKLIDQAQKEAAASARQIACRDTDLHAAQTKIQALVLELAHLRRMRFGAMSEAFSGEERDLFQDTLRVFPAPTQITAWREKVGAGDTATLAVHVSAREATRQLPDGKWVEFLRGLREAQPHLRLALFWSPGAEDDPRHPDDDAKAQAILAGCEGLGVIACPTATLDDLMAGLSCCDAFIGADGGVMHAAVAPPTFTIGDIEPRAMVAATTHLIGALRPC